MSPSGEKSNLKRPRVSLCARAAQFFFLGFLVRNADHLLVAKGSLPDESAESKKPRRSERNANGDDAPGAKPDKTPVSRDNHLPSPLTTDATYGSGSKELTPTPAGAKTVEQTTPSKADDDSLGYSQLQGLSSPPQDTQPVSQLADRHLDLPEDADEHPEEGVWGYLVPLDAKYGDRPKVLKRRCACPPNDSIKTAADSEKQDTVRETPDAIHEEEAYERTQIKGIASRGYLIGRHPECGKLMLFLHAAWSGMRRLLI